MTENDIWLLHFLMRVSLGIRNEFAKKWKLNLRIKSDLGQTILKRILKSETDNII